MSNIALLTILGAAASDPPTPEQPVDRIDDLAHQARAPRRDQELRLIERDDD